jgi:hypothetical protein
MNEKKTGIEKVKAEKKRGRAGDSVAAMRTAAAAVGVSIGDARESPMINLGKPIDDLARDLGQVCRKQSLFMFAGRLVTICERTGEARDMKPNRFCTWAAEFVTLGVKGRGGDDAFVKGSMKVDQARLILEADGFIDQIRPCSGIELVKFPVWNEERTEPVLLENGYDERTGIFQLDTLPYDQNLDVLTAVQFLLGEKKDYPWKKGGEVNGFGNDQIGKQIGVEIGVYARHLIDGNRPIVAHIADQQGTGKTMLAKTCLIPSFGKGATSTWSKDPGINVKLLEALAGAGKSYILFDNVKGSNLSLDGLENWVTSEDAQNRPLGTGGVAEPVNTMQVFLTANGASFNQDLQRRLFDIHLRKEEFTDEEHEKEIDESYLKRPDVRSLYLAAYWALVRNWRDLGCPREKKTRPSFRGWFGIVGGIIHNAGLRWPIDNPDASTTAPFRLALESVLAKCAVARGPGSHRITAGDLIAAALDLQVERDLVYEVPDEELDESKEKQRVSNLARKLGTRLGKDIFAVGDSAKVYRRDGWRLRLSRPPRGNSNNGHYLLQASEDEKKPG